MIDCFTVAGNEIPLSWSAQTFIRCLQNTKTCGGLHLNQKQSWEKRKQTTAAFSGKERLKNFAPQSFACSIWMLRQNHNVNVFA